VGVEAHIGPGINPELEGIEINLFVGRLFILGVGIRPALVD
jgi:hypothetical protein